MEAANKLPSSDFYVSPGGATNLLWLLLSLYSTSLSLSLSLSFCLSLYSSAVSVGRQELDLAFAHPLTPLLAKSFCA